MNVTVSPQMRIVVLVGLIALLGLGASAMLLGRKASTAETVPTVVPRLHPKTTPVVPAPVKPAAPTKPHIRPVVLAALKAGLPARVARAFARHDVVVVELYSASAPVDRLALTEARAGARVAGAGFVPVNVTARKDGVVRALSAKVGVLDAPTMLVFKRPGALAVQIDGFSDHETVAQAAVNAHNSRPAAA